MTVDEMEKRVAELGGWTEETALEVTIEKLQGFLNRDKFPSFAETRSDTCGLCQWFQGQCDGEYKGGCKACYLQGEGKRCCFEWRELRSVISNITYNYPGCWDWRKAVQDLLDVMKSKRTVKPNGEKESLWIKSK